MDRLNRGDAVKPYVLSRGTLYWRPPNFRKQLLVLPTAVRAMVFLYFHESTMGAHLGVRKTIWKIRAHFAWKGMDKEIESKVRACHVSSRSKPAQYTRLGLLSHDVAERPLQKLFIDFVGSSRAVVPATR
jgi:hypothetical protein